MGTGGETVRAGGFWPPCPVCLDMYCDNGEKCDPESRIDRRNNRREMEARENYAEERSPGG